MVLERGVVLYQGAYYVRHQTNGGNNEPGHNNCKQCIVLVVLWEGNKTYKGKFHITLCKQVVILRLKTRELTTL